jgi:hypothetical protein
MVTWHRATVVGEDVSESAIVMHVRGIVIESGFDTIMNACGVARQIASAKY